MSERLDALMLRLDLQPPGPGDRFDDVGVHVDEDVVAISVVCPGPLTGAKAEIDEFGRLLFRCLFFLYHGGLERAMADRPDGERDLVVQLFLTRQEIPGEIRSILEEFTTFLAARSIVLNVILTSEEALGRPS